MISPSRLSPVTRDAPAATRDPSARLDLFVRTTSLYQHAAGYYDWD